MRIGILGTGQLARMLAHAGISLGFDFAFYSDADKSAVQGLGQIVSGKYTDLDSLKSFITSCEKLTYEFENVDLKTLPPELLKTIQPTSLALEISQDRLNEKTRFRNLGINTAEFSAVHSPTEIEVFAKQYKFPVVLKTRRLGYDGKGQAIIRSAAEISKAFDDLGASDLIVESFVKFDRELSIIAVRSTSGEFRAYDLVQNHHHQGILNISLAPAPQLSKSVIESASYYAKSIMESLNYVGVFALELFQIGEELLANEMAPRVHNSGHWTIEGAECSQFENHIRSISGLELGSAKTRYPVCMVNIVGVIPDTKNLLADPRLHLHLYGKEARPGRKLGHFTIICKDTQEQLEAARRFKLQ